MRITTTIMLLAVCLTAAAGCSRKKTPGTTSHFPRSGSDAGNLDSNGSRRSTDTGAPDLLNSGMDAAYGIPEGRFGTNGQAGITLEDLPAIYFELDSYELTGEGTTAADRAADFLKANQQYQVALHGHTDDSGTPEYNMSLGSRRAQAVREHLINGGLTAERFETVSFGEERPAAEGEDDESRAKNRRVEFLVYEID